MIAKLKKLDPELKVVTPSREGGYHHTTGLQVETLGKNPNHRHWGEGPLLEEEQCTFIKGKGTEDQKVEAKEYAIIW